jgi:serine/threonine protein kinase
MATPQETRFLRLALKKKALSREQAKTCLEFQKTKLDGGSKIPIWDCTVLNGLLDQNAAEKLQTDAGELKVEKLGDFSIIRKLGQGGMGSVWEAAGPDKQRVAIKLLPEHLAAERRFLTRFFREAQASIKLQHKNIVRGVEVAEDQGNYFFAMEFVDGRSVRDLMTAASGPLPVEQATDIIRQAAAGLAYAHEHGIIHRDIKPDNLMVTRQGVVKIADLGLARQMDAEMTALTRTGTGLGTPYYMAPEQSTDAKHVDARSDIYSLGATWYHMVTGQVPFDGDTQLEIMQKHLKAPVTPPASVQPGIPRPVSLVIERMLAKEPDGRVQSMKELVDYIDTKCKGERDITDELGLQKSGGIESLWDVKVAAGSGIEKRRYSLSEVRSHIRDGRITRETPAKRAGERGVYQPAGSFKELEREFPRDYAQRVQATKHGTHTPRDELHNLVSHFDEAKKGYSRKKKMRKLGPFAIKALFLGIVVIVVVAFWPKISGVVSGIMGKQPVAEETAPAGE